MARREMATLLRRFARRRGTVVRPAWLIRLAVDDRGQDLVEYALLTAFFGVTALATWSAIEDSLGAAYTSYDGNVQDLWEPPAPGAAGP
jgi:Flp pilus assembly pilin Flp